MAKHTFRSRYGVVTVENGELTVGPPLNSSGFVDMRWCAAVAGIARAMGVDFPLSAQDMEKAGDEALKWATDLAYEAANDLLDAGSTAPQGECDLREGSASPSRPFLVKPARD